MEEALGSKDIDEEDPERSNRFSRPNQGKQMMLDGVFS